MRKLFFVIAIPLFMLSFSQKGNAQAYIDTSRYTVSATIKPSDYPEWPDSVGAWKIFATYDLNKNGKKEFLVIADPATGTVSTSMPTILRFEATGNNSYKIIWSAKLPGTNPGQFSYPDLTVADMDGDGKPEIFVAVSASGRHGGTDLNPPRIFVYEYDPVLGNFPSDPTMTSNLGVRDGMLYRATRVLVDDVDNDGVKEMVITSKQDDFSGLNKGRTLMVFHIFGEISQGFNSFEREFIDSSAVLQGGSVYDVGILDFDGDGKKELWVPTWDMLSLAIYESTGPDTYTLQADINRVTDPYDIGFRSSMHFFDGNGDGKFEMYAAGNLGDTNPGAVFYIGNVADVSTIDASQIKRISPWIDGENYNLWSLEGGDVGDIDGDGKVDYFATGAGTIHRCLYRLGYKSGPYDIESSYSWDSVYYAKYDSSYDFRNVAIANDLDGDSKKEILLANVMTRNGKADAAIIILESKVTVSSVRQIVSNSPNKYSLEQNFPNPFNPTSTIRFSLKNDSEVELFITNSLGQLVGSLVNEKKKSGTHEITFNADGLASGTYFYTIKTNNFTQTKKMILLK